MKSVKVFGRNSRHTGLKTENSGDTKFEALFNLGYAKVPELTEKNIRILVH